MKKENYRQKSSLGVRILAWIILTPIVIVLALIITLTIWSKSATYIDKRQLTAAANKIQLPANYELFHTDFYGSHCLDVCATMELHYRSRDGKPLDREIVNQEVERLGYHQPDYAKSYGDTTRRGNGLTIYQANAPAEYLTLIITK